ncbi:MAG: hypothetical protein JNM62_09265 [Flavobacteriales bacterium]|nr:hypothetical protein [Flavobacteriales bacterium]
MRPIVLALACVLLCAQAPARVLLHLQNVSVSLGPTWHAGGLGNGRFMELGYDRFARSCRRRKPFYAVAFGVGTSANGADPTYSLRFSLSPYRIAISRRVTIFTVAGLRGGTGVGHRSHSPFLRPEVGAQFMSYNVLLSPKVFVGYGVDMRQATVGEGRTVLAGTGSFTATVGISVNLATLRWMRAQRHKATSTTDGSN